MITPAQTGYSRRKEKVFIHDQERRIIKTHVQTRYFHSILIVTSEGSVGDRPGRLKTTLFSQLTPTAYYAASSSASSTSLIAFVVLAFLAFFVLSPLFPIFLFLPLAEVCTMLSAMVSFPSSFA